MNYRGFGGAWLVLWLLVAPAWAGVVAVGALDLALSGNWQRASAEEEAELASVILRDGAAEGALEVVLPGKRLRPKTDEVRFFEQLERSWQRRYGDRIRLDWLEAAGSRWRVCRRPSRSGESHVFELVAVHEGEAYQIMVAAPPGMDNLPDTVQALLAGAAWRNAAPVVDVAAVAPVVVEPAPAAPTTITTPATTELAPVAVSESTPAVPAIPVAAPPAPVVEPATAAVSPIEPPPPAKPALAWRLLNQAVLLPGVRSWAALADAETSHLGGPGMVDGLGLQARENGLEGYLEGFVRNDPADRKARCQFRQQWQVGWLPASVSWRGDELAFDLDVLIDAAGDEATGGLTTNVELTPACASAADMTAWLEGLKKSGPVGLVGLGKLVCTAVTGKPGVASVSVSADAFPGWPDEAIRRVVTVPAPAQWPESVAPDHRHLVLTLRFQVSADGGKLGDAMWREAVVVFVFGPDV